MNKEQGIKVRTGIESSQEIWVAHKKEPTEDQHLEIYIFRVAAMGTGGRGSRPGVDSALANGEGSVSCSLDFFGYFLIMQKVT